MSRLKFFMNNQTKVNKTKSWHFVIVLDDHNQCLKNSLPDIDEHISRLKDYFELFPTSHYLFPSMYKAGLHNKLPFYFMCMDAELLTKIPGYNPTRDRKGRIGKTNTHVISSFEEVIQRTEGLEKDYKHVVFYGGASDLNAMLPLIDKIHVTRVSGDFTELLPDTEIESFVFDNDRAQGVGLRIVKDTRSMKDMEAEENKPLINFNTDKISDHIKISYSNKTLKEKMRAATGIGSYKFQEINWTSGKMLPGYVDLLEGLKGKDLKNAQEINAIKDKHYFLSVLSRVNARIQKDYFKNLNEYNLQENKTTIG